MAKLREVDKRKLEIVEEYASSNEDLTEYVKSQGFKMTGNTMSCPFHGSDSTPSLKINGNKWKCFGCGRGGGYIKFRMEQNLLENPKFTYYDTLEKYAMEHHDLAALVDGTIYKSTEETMTEQWDEMIAMSSEPSYRPKKIEVHSNDKLIRKARKMDTKTKIQILAGIQDELPYRILESIITGTDLTGKTLFELSLES